MAETAAGIMVDTLLHWGVEVVFGLPGDGINGIMEALRRRQDKIRFVQVRHEEAAALMACGYAKYTGRLGVCLATSGPGGIHLLNGLYDAKLDGQPVLAITGHHFHDLIDTHAQQDVESRQAFCGRRGLQHADHGRGTRRAGDQLGLPHGFELSRRRAHQFSRGYAGLHIGRTLAARCRGSCECHPRARFRLASGRRLAIRRRDSQQRDQNRHPRWARRARRGG